MSRESETGALGEEYTAAYLGSQGFSLAARHFKRAEGEIDLVATGKGLVLFVEVKTRSAGALYPAAYAVTPAKRRRILLTARRYLAESGCDLQPRCDVALVTADRGRVLGFTYLENAF